MPYRWRKQTPEQREEWLARRKLLKRPWHRPPHFDQGNIHYHLSAACFEHRPHIGYSDDRLEEFSRLLLDVFPSPPAAWCVLPNHYHLLIRTADVRTIVSQLGQLHGKTSFQWNGEEGLRGRQVWHSASDRGMQNSEHFWATVNYIHNNPVKHGYVESWQEWPFSCYSLL